ncbi:MAG: trigger factor, partial [Candidatus Kerfeldbacteria bacterium]|nr:trigger factor [Candidatus Kerfeldbacteria bacterium]
IPGFEENLVGLKKEDKKIFDLQFPADYHGKEVAGKKGTFNVTMKSVFEVKKPELDDAFAKRAGKFSTLTELRAELTKNLQAEADHEVDRKLENDLIDELIHSSSFGDIPEILMESELAKMLHELEEEVERQGGLKFADYLQGIKKTAEELKKEFRPQAERRIKAALLIRAIGEQEKIMVDDAAIDQEVQQTLKMYEQDPSIKERIDSEDYRDYVRTMLTNRKVIELLKTKVAM